MQYGGWGKLFLKIGAIVIIMVEHGIASASPIQWIDSVETALDRAIPGESSRANFKFKNISKGPIIITAVSSSCRCYPKYEKNPILSGVISSISFSCNFLKTDHGRFINSFYVDIHSVDGDYQEVLKLNADVGYKGTFDSNADKTYRKYQNALTIHIAQSPDPIRWNEDPSSVLYDLANNKYLQSDRSNKPIGHVTVELNCTDKLGNSVRRIGGQAAKSLSEFSDKIINQGYGFSVLLQPKDLQGGLENFPLITIPGKFEYEKDVVNFIENLIWQTDLMAFATFLIKPEQCTDMVQYFDEYVFETENSNGQAAANKYGFGADPEKYEGAGCATFAEEFLKMTDYSYYPENFYQTVDIPFELFGDPENGRSVDILSLLASDAELSKPSVETMRLSFPDPNKLYEMVVAGNSKHTKSVNRIPIVERGKFGDSTAIYSVFDIRKCEGHSCL